MHEFFQGLHLDYLAMLIGMFIVFVAVGVFAYKADKYQQQLKKEEEKQKEWKWKH